MLHKKRHCPPAAMPRSLKWVPIAFAILSASCVTAHDIWMKYETGDQHKAYAIGTKGAAGAVWNYPTSDQAIEAAVNLCTREGGINCQVTHLNGEPYHETGLQKRDESQLEQTPAPEPASAPESVSAPQSAPAAEVVSVPEPIPAPTPAPAPKPTLAPGLASTGTGFLLSKKGQIITNAHVVDGCSISRILYQNKMHDVALIKVDRHNNLALLQSTITDHKIAEFEIDRIPRLDEPVIAFGYPLSSVLPSKPGVADGVLSSTAGLNDDSRYFQISAPVQQGYGGGPLLDKFGRVIGVVIVNPDDNRVVENTDAIPQSVNFAIKTPVVKAFLDSNIVAMNKPGEVPRQLSLPEITEAAALYTVQVGCFK